MATQNPRFTGLNRRDFFVVTAASLAAASVPRPETRGAPWYAAGSPRADPESTWLYRTCMFSAYFSAQMPAIYREINRRYPVDGFFTNGWPGTDLPRVCHCENCRNIYREKIGGTPPDSPDLTNPLYRRFSETHLERVKEIWRLWDLIAKERQRDSLYIGNLGGGIRAAKSLKQLSEVASWFNADHQGRSGNTPI